MDTINWLETLGWTDEHLDDIRNVGYAYIRQGKYETALPFFEALVVLDPSSSYDLQTLGGIYLEMDQIESAIDYFNKALEVDQDDSGSILLNLAKAYFISGNIEEGMQIASTLNNHANLYVASQSTALVLAYS